MSEEWYQGFIAGITLGLVLAMLWDSIKTKRQAKAKAKKIFSQIKQELSSNIETLKTNKSLIEKELETIFEENNIISPLRFLQAGSEKLFNHNIPGDVINEEMLITLRDITHMVIAMNEQIRNREEYRNSEHEVTVYYRTIKKLDERLLRHTDTLISSTTELQSML